MRIRTPIQVVVLVTVVLGFLTLSRTTCAGTLQRSWSHQAPATSPPARVNHALAYDSARGRTVLFGGYDSNSRGYFADTWVLPSFATPLAVAGPSRTVSAGSIAILDGSASAVDELQTATYSWIRSPVASGTGPAVSVSGATSATATFTPPAFATYTFILTVSDQRGVTSTSAATAAVTITANGVPTVSAGPNRASRAGVPVTLTATASDPDGDALSYSWARSPSSPGTGPSVTLASPTSASTSFTALVTGTYTFAVTAFDSRGGTATAPITITLSGKRWLPAREA